VNAAARIGRRQAPPVTAKLREEIKQRRPFRSAEAEAFLNLVRTAGALTRGLEEFLKPYSLTATQYNVLRILRGAGRAGVTCSEISRRMVNADPDVTRLLDRMEKRGLIRRARGRPDRRVVTATISPAGLRLAKELDRPLDDLHERQFINLSKPGLANLIDQLELIRAAEPTAARGSLRKHS
jgi:DNA-binding MarR family transcriptional regulator